MSFQKRRTSSSALGKLMFILIRQYLSFSALENVLVSCPDSWTIDLTL